jgi:predicted transcriptional regulator
MDSKESVYNVMKKAGKELRTGEIAELSGIDKKEVEKVVKLLDKEGKVFSPKRCFWKAK